MLAEPGSHERVTAFPEADALRFAGGLKYGANVVVVVGTTWVFVNAEAGTISQPLPIFQNNLVHAPPPFS